MGFWGCRKIQSNHEYCEKYNYRSSVGDPDTLVFWHPGSGTRSISQEIRILILLFYH
jgi:hypothetical protein